MPPAASLLTALLTCAFALQLLSVISTPIVKGIALGTSGDLTFGVFGFCNGDKCTPIGIGYNVDQSDSEFDLSAAGTRHTLASILVVHPVAAFFTLVLLACGIASHFHGPSHSTRFLLAFIVLFIPTFILSLLSFLVDILLFIPHVAWGGWIMLAATIILAVCGILTCAMRRTLVSRKYRKDRVADNAEMSGQNFYTRQNTSGPGVRATSPPPLAAQPTAPMVTGAPGSDKLPTFTTFESSRSRISGEDDRMPLNSADRTATGISSTSAGRQSVDGMERYGGGRGGPMTQGRGGRGYGPPRDQYGNPMAAQNVNPYGPGPGGRGSPMGFAPGPYSSETLVSGGSSMRGGRGGRGGYPPRGGYAPGRGGPYGGRGRGGSPPRGGYRGPPGAAPNGPPQGPYGAAYGGGNSPYGRRPSDPRYGQSPGPPPGPPPTAPVPYGAAYANAQQEPSQHESFYPRAESPPPMEGEYVSAVSVLPPQNSHPMHQHAAIGQAIEMDEKTGSPAPPPGTILPPLRHFSDSDSEVEGMVGLQQARKGSGAGMVGDHHAISPSSAYSSQRIDSYATTSTRPWTDAPGRNGTPPLPNAAAGADIPRPDSARRSPPRIQQSTTPQPQRARLSSGDHYYEDVDARFADREEETSPHPEHAVLHNPPPMTSALHVPRRPSLEQQKSFDSIEDGPESDASNFTSISQRGVNPAWPGDDSYGHGGVPNRRPGPQQQRDMMLAGNPDFEVPTGASRGRGGRM